MGWDGKVNAVAGTILSENTVRVNGDRRFTFPPEAFLTTKDLGEVEKLRTYYRPSPSQWVHIPEKYVVTPFQLNAIAKIRFSQRTRMIGVYPRELETNDRLLYVLEGRGVIKLDVGRYTLTNLGMEILSAYTHKRMYRELSKEQVEHLMAEEGERTGATQEEKLRDYVALAFLNRTLGELRKATGISHGIRAIERHLAVAMEELPKLVKRVDVRDTDVRWRGGSSYVVDVVWRLHPESEDRELSVKLEL